MTITAIERRVPRDVRSRETQRLLAEAAVEAGETRARLLDEVVRLNVQVAHAIAARYDRRGIALEDLQQVAALGLVQAAQRFDASQGRDFLSFAVPTMTGSVKRYFRDSGWVIRPPRRIQEIQGRVLGAQGVPDEHGDLPSAQQIADRLELSLDEVVESLSTGACFTPISFEMPVGSDQETTFGDTLVDPAAGFDDAEARAMLAPALIKLTRAERLLLQLYFAEDKSQREVGRELGITQMSVSRRLSRVMEKIRYELRDEPVAAA